jgi:hypothetical protein
MENSAPARRGRPCSEPRDRRGELTSRQSAIVRYITESVDRQGYPPSMREIGQAVKLAGTSSVAHQLMALDVTVRRQDSADQGDIVAALGQDCGAARSVEDQCSSAPMRGTMPSATRVVAVTG